MKPTVPDLIVDSTTLYPPISGVGYYTLGLLKSYGALPDHYPVKILLSQQQIKNLLDVFILAFRIPDRRNVRGGKALVNDTFFIRVRRADEERVVVREAVCSFGLSNAQTAAALCFIVGAILLWRLPIPSAQVG